MGFLRKRSSNHGPMETFGTNRFKALIVYFLLTSTMIKTLSGNEIYQPPTAQIVITVRKRRTEFWEFWQVNSSEYIYVRR